MNEKAYITYEQMEAYAKFYYQQYNQKSGFKNIVSHLFNNNESHYGTPNLPTNISWQNLTDLEFYGVLNQLPITNSIIKFSDKNEPSKQNSPFLAPSISADAIMPQALEVYSIKYVENIVEKMHTHNFFEINYVMHGNCELIFENEQRILSEGDFCVIAPYSRHDVTISNSSIVISLMLRKTTFETTFFQLLTQEDLLSSFFRSILYSKAETANYILFETDNNNEIKSYIKNIFMESHIYDNYSNTRIINHTHLLFSFLLRHYSTTIEFYNHQNTEGNHINFVEILKYIQNHYQTISLELLAETFHYNPSYMSRMIKKNTGRNFMEILTDLKLTKASFLLLNSSLKIHEISSLVGYECVDHFSRSFKAQKGLTPTAYRLQLQNII